MNPLFAKNSTSHKQVNNDNSETTEDKSVD